MAKIISFKKEKWSLGCAILIQECLDTIVSEKGKCSILLTGGRSAQRVYEEWGKIESFGEIDNVSFYMTDERCVSYLDDLSNYKLIVDSLFQAKISKKYFLHRMQAEITPHSDAAKRYASILPDEIDILLITAGDDGHIASIFAFNDELFSSTEKVMHSLSPIAPYNRISITPKVIKSSNNIFVFAPGNKSSILNNLKKQRDDELNIPAYLVLNATWLIEEC
jgi:6-phosphogluconolactonase